MGFAVISTSVLVHARVIAIVLTGICVIAIVLSGIEKAVTSASSTMPQTGLGWQAHSMNDLRLWNQLALKSTRNMLSLKVDPHDVTEDGLFRLTHDAPVEGINYFTTRDLLDHCTHLLQEWPVLALRVALCFKQGANACDSSTESAVWLEAMDNFYSNAERLRSMFPGRLEFVLDGNAKPTMCLKDRWRPWNATWIPGDHSPALALFSNDISKGYDRFAVMNPPDKLPWWPALRLASYGKFLRGHYPFQLWEPDAQSTIMSYASSFISGAHVSNPNIGFDFAINIDPKMWSVFTASQSGQAWNLELPIQVSNASKPFLIAFAEHSLLLVLFKDGNQRNLWATFRADFPFGQVSPLKTGTLSGHESIRSVVRGRGSMAHVVTGEDLVTHFTVKADGSFEEIDKSLKVAGALAACLCSGGQLAVLVLGEGPGTFAVHNANTSQMLWVTPRMPGKESLVAADIVEDAGVFLVVVSNGTHVFLATQNAAFWKLLGVGAHVSLSKVVGSDLRAHIGLTTDGGFCFNSHGHNTQGPAKVCDQSPKPCVTALDYTVGTFDQWSVFAKNSELATPCSDLLHGTYDFGSNPSTSLIDVGTYQIALYAVHAGASAQDDTCSCGTPLPRPGKLVLDGFLLNSNKAGKVPLASSFVV